jgi:hypothetical protein
VATSSSPFQSRSQGDEDIATPFPFSNGGSVKMRPGPGMLPKSDGEGLWGLKDSGSSRRMVRWVVMTSNPSRIAMHARAPMALGVRPLAPTCFRVWIGGARQEIRRE